jgi:hypothetical protein
MTKSKFPNDIQSSSSNDQKIFTFWDFGHYLIFGLPARSRFGEGRCLGFGAE